MRKKQCNQAGEWECPCCKKWKPENGFFKDLRTSNKLRSICKICDSINNMKPTETKTDIRIEHRPTVWIKERVKTGRWELRKLGPIYLAFKKVKSRKGYATRIEALVTLYKLGKGK
jgi:hypothetical protein